MSLRVRKTSASGFSLIELLAVAIIMGVGLLGLAALTTMAVRGYGGSRSRDTAANLANSVMDRLTLDGRLTAAARANGTTSFPGALVANASNDSVTAYADPTPPNFTDFDVQGQPTNTAPFYKVTWVRRSPKAGLSPAPTSQTASAEVVVNVQWIEAEKTAAGVSTTSTRYISISRSIRY